MAEITITATDGNNADHAVTQSGDSLTGSGSAGATGGASTTKTETDANGDTVETKKEWTAKPADNGVSKVTVKVSRPCPGGTPPVAVSLELSGNSVTGRVSGNCVYATAVTTSTEAATGIVTTVTTSKKACCGGAGAGSGTGSGTGMDMPPIDSEGEFALRLRRVAIDLDRATLESILLLKRIFS